ncbi:MAG TPA: SDR family NAD(P)-dependent oxidoreductase [Pseudonocardiaceae bacterium]|jgi:short-subunit dehydrogenase|nr:SDR family NAD(P)-dependent oxidoreductase [Pseudonocardiaceae bacterium]
MTEYRPLALVTGASSGIGLELAKQFVDHDYDLLINSEDRALDTVAVQLAGSGVSVQPIRADLRTVEGVERLWEQVAATGRPLDVAALNAGVGEGGPFLETDLSAELEIIDVNVRSTVVLAKRVLRAMAARDEGKVLITSSIASTMPGSFQAVYNASKSFLQSFTEALQNELKDTGITITALMPGPTETNFFHRAQMDDTKVGQMDKDDPAEVARQGFEALMEGKETITASSMKTKAQAAVNKVLPDKVKAAAHRRMAEPGSGDE